MKKLLLFTSFISMTTFSYADQVKCDDNNTKALINIAKNNGYEWPGTIKTAKCDLGSSYAITWSGPASSSAIAVTMMLNPARLQYRQGGSIDMFCVKLSDGQWKNVGKTCS